MKTLNVDGREYRVDTVRLEDFIEVERHLRANQKSPLEAIAPALEKLPKECHEVMLRLAYEDLRRQQDGKVSEVDVKRFLDSLDGRLWAMRQIVRRSNPGITDAETEAVVLALVDEAQAAARGNAAKALSTLGDDMLAAGDDVRQRASDQYQFVRESTK